MNATTRIKDRVEGSPARKRAEHAAEAAKERAEELAAVARERAADAGEQARDRASDVAETVRPWLSRLLAALASILAGASERGREVAARVEPPASVRRRRKLVTAGWFAGGFLAGAATGWVLHARMREEPEPGGAFYADTEGFGDETGEAPYGSDAEAIDARRENAPFG